MLKKWTQINGKHITGCLGEMLAESQKGGEWAVQVSDKTRDKELQTFEKQWKLLYFCFCFLFVLPEHLNIFYDLNNTEKTSCVI